MATQNGVFIGLGSNLGDRQSMLRSALDALVASGLRIAQSSSIYETEPVGGPQQPTYLNMVVEVSGEAIPNPITLLHLLHQIEHSLGRDRRIPNGPRTIDLDLLLYGTTITNHNGVTIPHPRLHERRFVLLPLSEIAPETIHPVLQTSIRKICETLIDPSRVLLWHPHG